MKKLLLILLICSGCATTPIERRTERETLNVLQVAALDHSDLHALLLLDSVQVMMDSWKYKDE